MQDDTVFRRLITSMKFWTMILGGVATAGGTLLAKYGLSLSDAAIQQIAGSIVILFSILVHAQGQTDLGKNAAPSAPEALPAPAPAPAPEGP